MTDTTGVTTYTYDAVNRLTSVGGVTYTWDARGNLLSDGTFTYAYNSAGRMVRAQNVTATLVYTYNAQGLRVAQSIGGDETTFAWDWASGVPEMLRDGGSLYLVGHDTLARWDGDAWAYHLPDALGSVRQVADGAGAVASSREWTPFGVEVGTAQAGPGYTGEWWDADMGLLYLRARWYAPSTGRFTRQDEWKGDWQQPQSLHSYVYARNNAVNFTDPTGKWADPVWPDSWADKPRWPNSSDMASIDLDRTWIAESDKPACCLPEDRCQCIPRAQVGKTYSPASFTYSSADAYIKFWLAWEYKANPCYYREHANCMAAALEVSRLYRGWSSPALVNSKYTADDYETTGFMNPTNWENWVGNRYFKRDRPPHRRDAGDIVTYTPHLPRGSDPARFIVIIENGLCFEKQSPSLPHAYYQLRPCGRGALYDWRVNEDFYHPILD